MELFQFRDELDTYIFRTDRAKEIVADGRSAVPIAVEAVRVFLGMNEFDLDHLGHVDPAQPGIFTRRFGGPFLLDGVHRATRCFAEQQQFFAFELTYEESLECLVQQRVSAKDAAAIVRKLRRAQKYFPGTVSLDIPIECRSQVLQEVEKMLTAKERNRLTLRAVPEPR